MGIGSADAEGGDSSSAWMPRLLPRTCFGEQGNRTFCPIDMGSRLINMQGLGEDAVAHGHDHLDDPANPSSSLCVTNVGLE